MNRKATAAEKRHMDMIAAMPCVLCEMLGKPQTSKTDVHHIREGQGVSQRASNFLVIPLCHGECHQGPLGIHGDKTLLRIAKVREPDLLAITIAKISAHVHSR